MILGSERRVLREPWVPLQVAGRGVGGGAVVHVDESLKVRDPGDVDKPVIAEQDRPEVRRSIACDLESMAGRLECPPLSREADTRFHQSQQPR